VLFEKTLTVSTVQSKDIANMQLKDYMHPSTYGVGFLGYGHHKAYKNGRTTGAYACWRSMIQRCYDKKCKSYAFYSDCAVHSEWHNFQVFARWYCDNHIKGYHLDKDLLFKGNRLYSKNTCAFITPQKNIALAHQQTHSFISPDGTKVRFTNLNRFCEDNGLCRINMSRVKHGHRRSHKGWTAL